MPSPKTKKTIQFQIAGGILGFNGGSALKIVHARYTARSKETSAYYSFILPGILTNII
jgi:hypothetical protein